MFAAAFRGDPDFRIPELVTNTARVLVGEWVDGTPVSSVIASGDQATRDRAGLLLVRFLYSCPGRAGLLHADPHPGNFRLTADGRLCVLDFGAVNRLPGGLPEPIGRLARLTLDGESQSVLQGLRELGFVKPSIDVDAEAVLDYLRPILDPIAEPGVHLQPRLAAPGGHQARRSPVARLPARPAAQPPAGVPADPPGHAGGTTGVLCQLGSHGAFRAEMERWQPGFAPPGSELGEHAIAANRAGRRLPTFEPPTGPPPPAKKRR